MKSHQKYILFFQISFRKRINHWFLKKKKPCIPEEIAGIFFVHLILGLETVHEKNMLHRDLKPENLLLVKNSSLKNSKGPLTWNECTLKISDFGFSRQLPTDTFLAQTFCGTQVYMSPEVIWTIFLFFFPFCFCLTIQNLQKGHKRSTVRKEIGFLELWLHPLRNDNWRFALFGFFWLFHQIDK